MTELRLNCFVVGEGFNNIIAVQINDVNPVSVLKEAIKTKKNPDLDYLPADKLVLYKVGELLDNPFLKKNKDIVKALQDKLLTEAAKEKLKCEYIGPMALLSGLFSPYGPTDPCAQCIHV